ncbi:MAG: bifunctional riboflavin kinase/FAD synthetase [Bacteroides sp.]|nr:bifunctional riboflavin kinase/FAD synthetase [Bacteroides sp.]
MQLITDFSAPVSEPCVATIGFFDGVHRGHRYLIDQVKAVAESRGLSSAVLTFSAHPGNVIRPDRVPDLLTTTHEKIGLLEQSGIDSCFLLRFTSHLSRMGASEFMEKILYEKFHVRSLLIGHDHRFGHNRTDSFDDYQRMGCHLGIEVLPALSYMYEGVPVSSSLVRNSLLEGRVEDANRYLGYSYSIQGQVVGGYQIGRTLGFPTANLQLSDGEKLLPAAGVYAVYVYTGADRYKGMLNIGHRPTIGNGSAFSIEVHLLHFSGNLYNCPLRVEFVHRLRSEVRFADRSLLICQLEQDAMRVEQLLS